MARLELRLADAQAGVAVVTLSRRNLLTLPHKLEMRGSARTLTNSGCHLNFVPAEQLILKTKRTIASDVNRPALSIRRANASCADTAGGVRSGDSDHAPRRRERAVRHLRRGTGAAEERLMDAFHYLQHALIFYDGCREDLRELRAEVAELLLGIPGASERINRARDGVARGTCPGAVAGVPVAIEEAQLPARKKLPVEGLSHPSLEHYRGYGLKRGR